MVTNYTAGNIVKDLKTYASPRRVGEKRRFGLSGGSVLGGPDKPFLRKLALDIKRVEKHPHQLAGELWQSGIHEAMILAGLIDDPKFVTEAQMERWVKDFENWGICDNTCGQLFDRTPLAYKKAIEWSGRQAEYVKRAGFTLMASLAAHDKKASDDKLLQCFPHIKQGATDERNFVKKAVSWALRQIGKRNLNLSKKALILAEEIGKLDSKAAWWVARDVIRELKKYQIIVKKGKAG